MKYRTLITDFDNTLYDWFDVWSASFSAMLDTLVGDAGDDRERLIAQIRRIHQKHGTSEYAYLLNELKCEDGSYARFDKERINAAASSYQLARSEHLKLYPNVLETLLELKKRRVNIVIYTESLEIYTNGRVIDLGLDGVVDEVYSPPNHVIHENNADYGSLLGIVGRKLSATAHSYLPEGLLKPNPEVLTDIMNKVGATASSTLYIGDSMMKDIAMAQEVGVHDVLAEYGKVQHREDYELLRRVSHWTDAEVEREKLVEVKPIKPTEIVTKFSDILRFF